MTAIEL